MLTRKKTILSFLEKQISQPQSISLLKNINTEIIFPKDIVSSNEKHLYSSIEINNNITENLKKYCLSENISEEYFLYTIFVIFISKICNQSKFTPILLSIEKEKSNIYNFYPTSLEIADDTFQNLLNKIKFQIKRNKRYSEVKNEINLYFLNTMFSYNLTSKNNNNLKIDDPLNILFSLKLFLNVFIKNKNYFLEILYDATLFKDTTIKRWLNYYLTIIINLFKNTNCLLNSLKWIPDKEQDRIQYEFNNSTKNYNLNICLHQLFEKQVKKTPLATVLSFENETVSYKKLNKKANKLAYYFLKNKILKKIPVGILMERSIDLVVALIAVLKAGCAYLPLDPQLPAERLDYIIKDSRLSVIISTEKNIFPLKKYFENFSGELILQDTINYASISNAESIKNPDTKVTPEDLAYIIYTSGSTGNPKGVMIQHKAICNRLFWMQSEYKLSSQDKILQKTPFNFDVSVWEFFWPLMVGAKLVMAIPDGHKDNKYLIETIISKKISVIHFVPSMLQAFLQEQNVSNCTSLKNIICSGEELLIQHQKVFYEKLTAKLHNLYGPTEASIDVTFWECPQNCENQIMPIGKPIANTQIYILDDNLNLLPIGIPGKIYISGIGLSCGYINRPDLTKEKFINNPFLSGTKLYNTGDMGRWLEDRTIEFLGRNDYQIQLRGFRIEPGEIEAALRLHPQVNEAIVMAKFFSENDKRLIAYITLNKKIKSSELKNFLEQKLPAIYIPSVFIFIENFPLNTNGKIDRKKLPSPIKETTEKIPINRNDSNIETIILNIWKDLLAINQNIGFNDNFFDLGGHSLLLIKMHKLLSSKFSKEIPLLELFKKPTIQSLIDYYNDKPEQKNYNKFKDLAKQQKRNINKRKHQRTKIKKDTKE